jgi:hypothetical protein
VGVVVIDGRPRPDFGPGHVERACQCGATWIGGADDPCWWCAQAERRQLDDQRRRLLWPEWMASQGPRYDELAPVDRAVWDRTRGILRGADSVKAWTHRLIDAVDAGIVTEAEARAALNRVENRRRD